MKMQKGQSIVEFAFVLPFLLGILLGIIYFGFVFSDYLALNSLARTISRDVSLSEENTASKYYDLVSNKYGNYSLPNSLYTWSPDQSHVTFINNPGNGTTSEVDSVKVTLTANADTSGGFYGSATNMLKMAFGNDSKIDTLTVEYTMRKENGRAVETE